MGKKRLRVALLFGGRSAEHDVSVLSARNVFRALDQGRYEIVPIGVTRTGAWILCEPDDGNLPTQVPSDGPLVTLLPGGRGRFAVASNVGPPPPEPVDVVFPVLHGPFGEDGS